jgi:hypothetical protein
MSYGLGLKAIRALVAEGNALAFHHAKLTEKLFKGDLERGLFLFVDGHLRKYQSVPTLALVLEKFPELGPVNAAETSKYYVDKLAERFSYDTVAKANKESHEILKEDPTAVDAAVKVLQQAVAEVAEQKYRHRITDFGAEGKDLVLQNYYNTMKQIDPPASFGWPYLDVSSGGILPGDFISIVGRPAMGKSFKMLYVAIHNWLAGKNVLFVSMEMNTLAIAQRTSSMYTHINLTQLKSATFSSHSLGLFRERISEAEKRFSVVLKKIPGMGPSSYDDIGCAVISRNSECATRQMMFDGSSVAYDYLTAAEVPVETAYFVFKADVSTPRGYGIVAFKDRAQAERFAAEQGKGKVIRWFELVDEKLK